MITLGPSYPIHEVHLPPEALRIQRGIPGEQFHNSKAL
jgi:hypothetical protein